MIDVQKSLRRERTRYKLIAASLAAAILIVLGITQALRASTEVLLPPNLSQSSKTVDKDEALAGTILEYQITIKNTGNELAIASLTDTLPAELTYVPNSLTVQNGGSNWGVSDNTISWSGGINDGSEVKLTFRATLSGSLAVDTVVTNTANIYLDGQETPVATPSATTTVVETVIPDRTTAYLPLLSKSYPAVTVDPISRTGTGNSWTVTWGDVGLSSVTGYQIQEATNPSFTTPLTLNVGLTRSRSFSHSRSFNNVYYYRVRALFGLEVGPWSNVQSVTADYYDDFNDVNSGWAMRRTSAESSSEWELSYRTDNILQLIVKDKNEYVLASPLKAAPALPIKFEFEASFNEFNNTPISDRQAFALIFGADWNGETCPNADYTSCFTSYYRLRFRWRDGIKDFWEYRLDWVKGHDSTDEPIVDTLIDWNQIKEPINPNSWNEIDVQIEPDGDIKIDIGDKRIHQVRHSQIATDGIDPYFGLEVSVKDKANARVKFPYFEVVRVQN